MHHPGTSTASAQDSIPEETSVAVDVAEGEALVTSLAEGHRTEGASEADVEASGATK